MSKRQKSGNSGGKKPKTVSSALKWHHRQYWTIRRKLEREGKWDPQRDKEDYVDTEPYDDVDFEDLSQIPSTSGGKQTLMTSNYGFKYCNVSDNDHSDSSGGYEREVCPPNQGDLDPYLEHKSSDVSGVSSSNFPLFYEGRNIPFEIRQAEKSCRRKQAKLSSGDGGGDGGVLNAEEYVRNNMLVLEVDKLRTWGQIKESIELQDLDVLKDYFQCYNSICIVIKCLPDLSEKDCISTYKIFKILAQKISDPFVLISEISKEGVLHWHMLWLTSKRTDNAKRLMQKYLLPVSKHFSIACQQTKSFQHILRYILKHPIVMCHANSPYLADYCYSLCNQDVVYEEKKNDTGESKMINELLKVMNEKLCYTTEELMKKAPEVMIKYLQKSNLDSIVQNCRMFLLKPSDIKLILKRITRDIEWGSWFPIYAYLMYQGVDIMMFLVDLINVLCRLTNKINVFCVQGISNAGKSCFFRPLFHLFQFGEVCHGGQFMFQSCVNKELIVWEEPLIGNDYVEICKKVMEGVPTQVPIKNKAPQTLYRTPIIITTNKDVWYYCDGDEQALRNRMFLYEFNNDALGFSELSEAWWRTTFECYIRDCEEFSLYITGGQSKCAARFKSDWSARGSQCSGSSEFLYSTRCRHFGRYSGLAPNDRTSTKR